MYQLFASLYGAFVLGVTLLMLSLCWRFVRAHESVAGSLAAIARKLGADGKA